MILTGKDNAVKNMEIPDKNNDRQVELNVFRIENTPREVEGIKVDYERLYGSLKSGLTVEEIDKQLNDLKREWE